MEKTHSSVISILKKDAIVCMPSDTVYGLMVSASSPEAVKLLYEVKGRENKPGTLIAASQRQLEALGFDKQDVEKAGTFWPGPVSVVLPAPEKLAYLHMGLHSLAVRIPSKEDLITLLKEAGPLATTSANRPGEPTVTTIDEAKDIFGDTVAHYVDGGRITGSPSTIYKLINGEFEKLR